MEPQKRSVRFSHIASLAVLVVMVVLAFGSYDGSSTSSPRSSSSSRTTSGDYYYVNTTSLNIRANPNPNADVVGALSFGDLVRVQPGKGVKSGGHTWVPVKNGYVSKKYLSKARPSSSQRRELVLYACDNLRITPAQYDRCFPARDPRHMTVKLEATPFINPQFFNEDVCREKGSEFRVKEDGEGVKAKLLGTCTSKPIRQGQASPLPTWFLVELKDGRRGWVIKGDTSLSKDFKPYE